MKQQRGFVLVVGMVMLFMITLLLLYLFRDALLQERMAGNAAGRFRALQAAETALREGEARIEAGGVPFNPFRLAAFSINCANGFCRGVPANPNALLDSGLQSTSISNPSANNLEQAPRYLIELISEPVPSSAVGCGTAVYRVLAKGWGSSGATVMAQSHYVHRPSSCQ
jgi:Tfp pilus assembly protein PilX